MIVKPEVHMWIWLRDGGKLMKATIDYTKGMMIVYEDDRLLLIRTGMSRKQLKQAEKIIEEQGGKRLHMKSDPFIFI